MYSALQLIVILYTHILSIYREGPITCWHVIGQYKNTYRPKPKIYERPKVRNICLSIQKHAWLGPLPWALKGPLPWALEEPLPWALEGPLPWALEGPLPWALEGPFPWALEGPLPRALEGPLPKALEGPLQICKKNNF